MIRVFPYTSSPFVDFLQYSAAFFTRSNLHSVVHGVSTSLYPQLAATQTWQHSHVHLLLAVHRATHAPFPAMHGDIFCTPLPVTPQQRQSSWSYLTSASGTLAPQQSSFSQAAIPICSAHLALLWPLLPSDVCSLGGSCTLGIGSHCPLSLSAAVSLCLIHLPVTELLCILALLACTFCLLLLHLVVGPAADWWAVDPTAATKCNLPSGKICIWII